jgi:hypothetical protein
VHLDYRSERSVTQVSKEPASKGIWPLLSMNFFMADMQAGIGRSWAYFCWRTDGKAGSSAP